MEGARCRPLHDVAQAADVIAAQAARIRELEHQLDESQDRARTLARSSDPHLVKDLDRQIRDLHATVAALREGRPDDALTAELRRQLHLERAQNKGLEQLVADLQAANSGIPAVPREAA